MQTTFLTQIQALHTDRFAIQSLSADEFGQFYHTFLSQFHRSSVDSRWYLIGTEDCHLCQKAYDILNMAFTYHVGSPAIEILDIMDSTDEMIAYLGIHIPLLLTPTKLLCYPFGMMDVLALN